jgi:hypothetical protein
MIGYKGTNKDGYCQNFQYKVGETYTLEGELKICENCFHFCQNIFDINYFYPFYNKNNEYYEIEALENISYFNYRSITDKIRIVRKLTDEDIEKISEGNIKWSDQGLEIYYKELEKKRIYNEQGETIYYGNPNGSWSKNKYNDQGLEIYYEDSNGIWSKHEYNEQGLEIYYESSSGNVYIQDYDEQSNIIYFENSSGVIMEKGLLKIPQKEFLK